MVTPLVSSVPTSPPVSLFQMKGKSEFLDENDEFDGEKGYGAVIGTLLVCSWVEVVLAFIKPEVCPGVLWAVAVCTLVNKQGVVGTNLDLTCMVCLA